MIDAKAEAIETQSRRTIESHLDDCKAKMTTAGRSDVHIDGTLRFIRSICQDQGFIRPTDIDQDGVNRFANKMRRKGRAARTIHSYLTGLKTLTRWLAAQEKLARDPLIGLQKPNPETDRRHERRILLPDEWDWLNKTTSQQRQERYGMAATQRVLLMPSRRNRYPDGHPSDSHSVSTGDLHEVLER